MDLRPLTGPSCPRLLVDVDPRALVCDHFDVVVIGSGVAGATAALSAAQAGRRVMVLAKAALAESNTTYAQGGVAAVLSAGERAADDSFEAHVSDTLSAGSGLCNVAMVRSILAEASQAMDYLRSWGCRFDANEDGVVSLTREGGHSARRILHAGGDATGREVSRALVAAAMAHPLIETVPEAFALDILSGEDGVWGVLWQDQAGRMRVLHSGAVILATGGSGRLWRETSNPEIATGDGLAMAYRAGAQLVDLEFYQFHPTTLYVAGAPRHLITEAMRGEGALLLNHRGERFMPAYHPLAELAPRDIVAQSIVTEIARSGSPHVWLDATHLPAEFLRARFPTIHATCAQFDIDITRAWIPVHPAAHYQCGGVHTNAQAATAVPGLWAVGEVAGTGLHGANRLASNSLLEGVVMGTRAGSAAALRRWPGRGAALAGPRRAAALTLDLGDLLTSLRATLWREVGILRAASGLTHATRSVQFWARHQARGSFSGRKGWELQNLLLVAECVARAALERTASVGTHWRSDSCGVVDPAHLAWHKPQGVADVGS